MVEDSLRILTRSFDIMKLVVLFQKCKRFIYENWRFFVIHSIACMGVLSGLVTIASVAYPCINGCTCIWYTCLGLSILWGIHKVIPDNNIEIEFIKKRTIKVSKGSIWDVKKGIIVVPVNNFFDTQVDDYVVGKDTLHGQFVNMYSQKYVTKDLDSEITNSIAADRINPKASYENRKHVKNGHNDAFQLGEIVRLKEGDLQYYLVVATQFDEDNHVIHEPEKYSMMLLRMIERINKWNSGVPVYLPIIGSGQTGLPLSKQEILTEMLMCFNQADRYVALGGTTIMVYDNDMKDVSLNKIKYQFNKI